MEKYDIIGPLGEGSFGRVYKAKQLATEKFVALKVISKRGRTPKEIKNLRKECEIQRTLNHPNIIQMLDSFETNDEIVVITEFAHKALHVILGNKGFLPENRVQTIVWDLVSALYYLHSHRVLHRDLKPQNILLDARDRAKLCDFGFARNMSTGTHVLTSIKGTPLYMAPELIDELPYDHNADLWSLGCIIYELLVGAPPFCTVSILHLIRLIRYKPVEWPTSLSQNCISFLKGLLQKDPNQRFTWATILDHPFVKGHILIQENDLDMPLTRPMSSNTLQRKEEQHNGHVNNKIGGQSAKALLKAFEVEDKKSGHSKTSKNSENGHSSNQIPHCFELDLKNNNSQPNLSEKFNNLSLESDLQKNNSVDFKSSKEFTSTFKLTEECHPIETEEWIAFLQKSIEEIINGEIISISQPNLANILVSPLRNSNTCPKVVTYVAKLFSIPFVVKEISKKSLEQIKKVYLEVKLVPNLVYSSKLLLRQKSLNTDSGPSSENSPLFNNPEKQKTLDEITENDLDGLENIFLLISHLVFLEEDFLLQFCDAIAVLNIYPLLQILIKLSRRKLRIVLDLIAILTHILRKFPEHIELVEKILINDLTNENDYIDFNILLRHEDMILRERICFCLMFLSKCNSKILETMWNENMKETLEALMFDSIEIVRNAAEKCVEEIKRHPYYYRIEITT